MADIQPMTDERLQQAQQIMTLWDDPALASSRTIQHDLFDELIAEVERQRAALAQYEVALGHAHESADFRAGILRNERESLWQVSRKLIAENAAMRPIVAAVAADDDADEDEFMSCSLCGGENTIGSEYQHANDCPVTQARVYLAAHPADEAS